MDLAQTACLALPMIFRMKLPVMNLASRTAGNTSLSFASVSLHYASTPAGKDANPLLWSTRSTSVTASRKTRPRLSMMKQRHLVLTACPTLEMSLEVETTAEVTMETTIAVAIITMTAADAIITVIVTADARMTVAATIITITAVVTTMMTTTTMTTMMIMMTILTMTKMMTQMMICALEVHTGVRSRESASQLVKIAST